jgi:hypothetical protein
LHQNYAFIFLYIPDFIKVVYSLAPLVNKKGWRFCVRGLYPIWKKVSFFCLIPKILVKICVCDFFQRLYIIDWNQMSVKIHEFNTNFFERSMAKQMSFYS